jgi:hypothetical protein
MRLFGRRCVAPGLSIRSKHPRTNCDWRNLLNFSEWPTEIVLVTTTNCSPVSACRVGTRQGRQNKLSGSDYSDKLNKWQLLCSGPQCFLQNKFPRLVHELQAHKMFCTKIIERKASMYRIVLLEQHLRLTIWKYRQSLGQYISNGWR